MNETESPAENITEEIEELKDLHQFFFSATNDLASFAYTDKDSKDLPIGLSFTLTTGDAAGSGSVSVILRHEPNKSADGVKDGVIDNAGGSTDVSVTFQVEVE